VRTKKKLKLHEKGSWGKDHRGGEKKGGVKGTLKKRGQMGSRGPEREDPNETREVKSRNKR